MRWRSPGMWRCHLEIFHPQQCFVLFVFFWDLEQNYVGSGRKTRSMFGKVVFKKETQMEIEKLLPVTFHFIIWGSPLPLIQELINVLRKCAVQDTVPVVEKHSDGFPDNIQLFLGQNTCFWKSRFLFECIHSLQTRVSAKVHQYVMACAIFHIWIHFVISSINIL